MKFNQGKSAALALSLVALTGGVAAAQHTFDGNIVFGNNPGPCTAGGSATFDACGLIAAFPNNDTTTDPQLGAPFNTLAPNWAPANSSIASFVNDNVVAIVRPGDACFTCGPCPTVVQPACFRGAVPPAQLGEDWTQGWTDYTFDGTGRVYPTRPVVILQGEQFASYTMTANNHYLLRGRVDFEAGTTLTIEPGVFVFGENSTVGTLVIERGARIVAEGTRTAPIVLTTDLAPGSMVPGGWGGLVINGRAIANCADCRNGVSCISEGTAVEYCGSNDCDDSGSLRYVRVEFAGRIAGLNNELNSFTFNGLGCGTRSEYLQAHRGLDDLFEWFGGKHEARYLVGTGGQDDGLDWQMGWRGAVQFAVIQQYGDNSDKGIEADNNEFDFNAPCRSNPTIANVTLLATAVGTNTHGIHLRRGTDATIVNSIVMGWPSTGIRVQNNETSARGFNPVPAVLCSPAGVDPSEVASLDVRTFPNPVVREARFFFSLPTSGRAQIQVFDANGRLVSNVLDAELAEGSHTATWNVPADAASGAYFYRVQSNDRVSTGRLIAAR